MKKLNLLFILLLSLTLSITNIKALDKVSEISGARYYVDEFLEENELPYGVTHTLAKGFTSTSLSGYIVDGSGPLTSNVVPGQYYPQQVNVLEVPISSDAKIFNWAVISNHRWSLQTVRGTISNFEQNNPGWKVIAAINGDFFDIGGTGNLPFQPNNSFVTNGEYYKATTGSNIGITNDGTTNSLIGDVSPVRTPYMRLAVYDEHDNIINQFNIENINQTPGENQTSVYYAVYGSDKKIIPVEVNVGNNYGFFVDNAELALPNEANSFYGRGTISSKESKTISTGQFGIVTSNQEVIDALDVGVKIRTQWEYVGDFAGVHSVAGCGVTIMKDGIENSEGRINNRAPRTVIGKKADGTIVMMVVDGRQSQRDMYGADSTELAAIMAYHDVVDAYNLDGGGSSTVIIRQGGELKVMNSPSDNRERTNSNAIIIAVKEPQFDVQVTDRQVDQLTLNLSVSNSMGLDINEIYMEMNNEFKEVINGRVSFGNLKNNNNYSYNLYYRNDNDELIKLITDGKTHTLKLIPEYLGLEIYEDGENFRIKIIYHDPDNASTLKNAEIGINDRVTGLWNEQITIKKSIIGHEIFQMHVRYSYNLGDGNRVDVLISPAEFQHFARIDAYISYINHQQHTFIKDIYR